MIGIHCVRVAEAGGSKKMMQRCLNRQYSCLSHLGFTFLDLDITVQVFDISSCVCVCVCVCVWRGEGGCNSKKKPLDLPLLV